MSYEPNGPYEFKSGKRKGEVLELMMFKNYRFLDWFFEEKLGGRSVPEEKKNELHRHLEWLLDKGENRKTEMLCPCCSENKVEHFAVKETGNDFSIDVTYTSCDKKACKRKLTYNSPNVRLEPFRFSVMKKFYRKIDQRRVGDLFREVFNLPTRPDPLTREIAFDFFKKPP